jgi:transcriptional regulator with XRE-family HTH domain
MTRARPESANLRAELARAGMTQQDVAELIGTWAPDVSWRMKTRRWRPGDLEKIAEHLGVPLEVLDDSFVPDFYQRATG